jgi:hypothetical protein
MGVSDADHSTLYLFLMARRNSIGSAVITPFGERTVVGWDSSSTLVALWALLAPLRRSLRSHFFHLSFSLASRAASALRSALMRLFRRSLMSSTLLSL